MEIWEKFDKAVDTKALAKDVEVAAEGSNEFKEIPLGTYEVAVTKIEIKESKKGSPMLSVWMKIINGEYNGSIIFYNQVLSTGFGIHNANNFLKSLDSGVEIEFKSFAQYHNVLLDVFEAIDGNLEYGIKYGKNDKGYNTYEITEVFES
jgi:hypothetical protein